jgi:hypothetical protein
VLAGEGATDARKFGRGVIGERAVGFDLATKGAQQVAEVVLEQPSGKRFDGRPTAFELGGRQENQLAPSLDPLGVAEQRKELGWFEC